MKDPVAPLRLALYGHPHSGGIWEQHCTKELTKAGFVAVLPDIWPSVFHHPKLDLLLVIYVDDFKMAVPEKNMEEGWKLLGEVIDMGPAEVLGSYFGCMRREETQVKLPPSAHPFHEVFEKGNKTAAASVRHEDFGILILRTCWPLSIIVTLVSVCMFPPRMMFPCFPP